MTKKIIFGIDIAKGSLRSKERPGYAVVILRDGQAENYRMVSQHKFLRMAWKEKPEIIAVDNIYEIVSDKHDLAVFLQKLPFNTKLVQVTGGEHLEPLTKLAKQQGISFDRFDPGAEALACARLAEMGTGYEVSAFEDKTVIKVSRARSPGKGGWSQNRYRRKVHGHVRQKAREIEDYLTEQSKVNGYTFTREVTERFGGYSRSVFYIDAPRSLIHVGSRKYGDVQVNVKSIERDVLAFKPLRSRKREYIIAGIDPGTTTGIAVLSLDGELRMVHSSRTASISSVIEMIAEQGRPLIVATDVYPTPNTVEKIRRAFNAVPGSPDDVLTSEAKIDLARSYEYSNNHERDAIAAAVSVYRKNKNKFEQIKKKIPAGMDINEVIARVMKGRSVDTVITEMTAEEKKVPETGGVPEKMDGEIVHLRESVRRHEESINEMKKYNEELKNSLTDKERKIMELEELIKRQRTEVYKKLKKEKEMTIRDKEIKRLKHKISDNKKRISHLSSRINKLKQVRRLEISGRVLPVKIISAFTKDSIQRTQEQFGIKRDDIILIKDASGGGAVTARILSELGIRCVIVCNEMSHAAEQELFDLDIPVLDVKEVNVQIYPSEELAVIDPAEIERVIKNWESVAEKRKLAGKEKWLESLMDEYRSERRRGVKE